MVPKVDKVWAGMRPAVQEAIGKYDDEFDEIERDDGPADVADNPDHLDGALLATRIRAALQGSDWRYVRRLGGTLEREIV